MHNEIWEWMEKRQKAYEATDNPTYAKENATPMKADLNDSGNKSMNKGDGAVRVAVTPKTGKPPVEGKHHRSS